MPPRTDVGLAPAPKANFVKFKEWLAVTEGRKGTRASPAVFQNPFLCFAQGSYSPGSSPDSSGGYPTPTTSGDDAPCSGGYPTPRTDRECKHTLESFMKTLQKANQSGITRQLDGIDESRRIHEYPCRRFTHVGRRRGCVV